MVTCAPIACKHKALRFFHSPPGAIFFTFLTVLFYRSIGSILALGGGPPCFTPASRVRCYSGATRPSYDFAYRTITSVLSFQTASAIRFLLCEVVRNPTPRCGLGSSPFAPRESMFACLPLRLLRCFSSQVASIKAGSLTVRAHYHAGFPHSDICGSQVVAPLRSFSAACRVASLLLPGIRLMHSLFLNLLLRYY